MRRLAVTGTPAGDERTTGMDRNRWERSGVVGRANRLCHIHSTASPIVPRDRYVWRDDETDEQTEDDPHAPTPQR
jgi:hypothetical protein